ncbi:ABC transporter permease subunit [Glaciimonas sp. Gout2]|uniref:ABC transporter permease n=1 Tax=unclassified Glaciimonas TaxID=2644401 RepID=UPI002B23711B|nr:MULTISPECIES: ABC transporter permease subunit [unclassified Glaciimonas]MEB0014384.1 ABC transporter permease subunit [Glaciimonas sp. Cout2]MEB0084342.1 ABC transporter permease subunit [Glaciimonas sp. Gout2]
MNWRALLLPVTALAAAEALFRIMDHGSDTLAPPTQVAAAAWHALIDGTLVDMTVQTLSGAGVGLAIGGSLGVLLGIPLGLSRTAMDIGAPTIELLRPIPSVALIPLALLVFGMGILLEASIVAFATFWPMLILTQSAAAQVEPRLLEVARVMNLGAAARVVKIVLPAMLPRMFVALRQVVGISLVVAVTVEITVNPYGLGYGLIIAQQNLRPDLMLALLAWVGILGWTINVVLHELQHRLFGAYSGMQGGGQ